MNPRILLIGKNGQIGRELSLLLPRLGPVAVFGRAELNLEKPEQIRTAIRSIQPTAIINAAAYTAVDQAESEEYLARAINEDAPAILAEEAQKSGALLVHYSTDYVFDGMKGAPYTEDDTPRPQSVYGRTKLGGELAIHHSGAAHLIFRTAWVYGREGRNFLLTMLRLATQREELRIVHDQIGSPTWSHEIARATLEVLSKAGTEGWSGHSFRGKSGIYHLTAHGETNWCDFARAILREAREATAKSPATWFSAAMHGRPLIVRRVMPIASCEYPTAARRPAYSVLSNRKLADTFGVRLSRWEEQLHQVFQEPGMAV